MEEDYEEKTNFKTKNEENVVDNIAAEKIEEQ